MLYDELTATLNAWVQEFPNFIKVESAGKSYEGRDVWGVTVTNLATGTPESKPAMYIDGNIHAGEVTGSMANLHLIYTLLTSDDPKVKKLRDTRTYYVIPRVNPDGAELYLTTPTYLRSSVRPFPDFRKDEDPAGLHQQDINGDGRIQLMRIRNDQHGAWKISGEDNRMMVERTPFDLDGPFYNIYSEGVLFDDKGQLATEVKYPYQAVPTKYGLDLNRNFPAGYSPHTPGSGPFPLSENETRNQVEFINKHPNIGGALLYHTTGGILFRPHSTISDKDFPKADIAMYHTLADIGTQTTGYPEVCCYGDIWSGVLDDWLFEYRGVFAFTPELWDAVGRAAPEMKKASLEKLSKEDANKLELKLLEWNDRELAGNGFSNWQEFDHPQLGKVEIGGWKSKECRQNPPFNFLEQECYRLTQFAIGYGLSLPEAHIDAVEVGHVSDQVYHIEAVVSNHGFMSTNISEQAIKQKAVRPDLVRIQIADDAILLNGERQTELGYLQGYSAGQQSRYYRFGDAAVSAKRLKWTVQLPAGCNPEVQIQLISARGGSETKTIQLS